MSGSYDRPSGPRAPIPPPEPPRSRHGDDVHTDTYTQSRHYDTGAHERNDEARFTADYRSDFDHMPSRHDELDGDSGKSSKGRRPRSQKSGVVPAGSVTSRSLTLVVAIMCFLACLTAGGVYMVNKAASAWLSDIASEVTVQVEPVDGVDVARTVRDVTVLLASQSGIRSVRPYTEEESADLVEPWLGKTDLLKTLPIPRLIAVEIDNNAPPDLEKLSTLVSSRFSNANLDDHRYWKRQIRTVTRTLALGGLAILMLVGAATTAIIISATRSSMASNREIVEVLHLVGATDRYIAREFERHFLRLGIKAGLVGALCAMGVFLGLPMVMDTMGGNAVTMAEMRRLFGTGAMDMAGYGVLVIVVIVIAGLCRLTSRYGVYNILDQQH
ncbi:MAG: cell division protein FtsX [Hyphomicrobiaceae bacterium]